MADQDGFFHYLPVNEKAMSCGVYVTGAGCATIGPGERYPPSGQPALYSVDWLRGRTLPEFQLVLTTAGAGEFESEATGRIRLKGTALVFVLPGVWHRYRPDPEVGWSERWFSVNGELIHRLFDIGLFGPTMAVATPRDPERLIQEFDELLHLVRRRSVDHPAGLAFKALRIVAGVVAEQLEEAESDGALAESVSPYASLNDPVVQRALELIWSHSNCPMSVSDIARQLPVTRRTLDRRFSEATGRSVLEEINHCRLTRAKRLLVETDLPVKTIARLAAYSSTERMRVAFVEREGVSPTVYRKQAAESRSRFAGA